MTNFKGQTKRSNKTKNEQGITLVALIITIIILIILAAVTINSLTHDGLADLAIKSTQDYQKAQTDEMNMLNEIDNMVKETVKNLEDGTVKPKPEKPVIPSNPWDKDYLDEVKVKDEDGNDVSIPKPDDSTILNPDATVDEGIVMKDSKDNEWVWVPVDEATYNSMFAESATPIALCGNTGVTTKKYSISAALIGQTQVLPGNYSNFHEPDLVTGKDNDNYSKSAGFSDLNGMATKLVSEYNTMADSIKKYSGFYIGRYELSSSGLKANESPTVSTTWYNLYRQCKNLTVDETKGVSRMIWRMSMGYYMFVVRRVRI